MSALARFVARLRGPAVRADAAPLIERPPRDPAELARAHDKRRLERILRDRGLSRAAAASVVREYFH